MLSSPVKNLQKSVSVIQLMCFNRNTWPTWFGQGRLKINTFATSIKTDIAAKPHQAEAEQLNLTLHCWVGALV